MTHHFAYPCRRCKAANSAPGPKAYCVICRGNTTGHRTIPEDESPWDIAVAQVERFTGVSRDIWVNRVNHPYGRAADKLAKHLATTEKP